MTQGDHFYFSRNEFTYTFFYMYIFFFLLCTLSSRGELSWICMIFRERSQCLLVVQEKSTACDDAFVLANPFGIWVVYLALQHK